MNTTAAMRQYQQVGVHSGIMDASPHRLVQMLMEGVLEKLALAKGNINRQEFEEKGENINKAMNIIGGLRASLDMEAGGEIAQNLDDLYDYMIRRLMLANSRKDNAILDELYNLMADIKISWETIPEALKN